jgi:uncharacterized membrane protein (UPF0127 family)
MIKNHAKMLCSIWVVQLLGAGLGLPAWNYSVEAAPLAGTSFQSKDPKRSAVAFVSDRKVIIRLKIAANTKLVPLEVELADTEAKKERGLMFRKSLPENSGMLFVFDPPAPATFWMKNTRIPLSIAFVDNQGRILEVRSMQPLDETFISSISNAVAYALEVNAGWFERHGVRLGTKIYGIPSLNGNSELHVSPMRLYRESLKSAACEPRRAPLAVK